MDPTLLSAAALASLPFEPLPQQFILINALSDFICRHGARDVFLLNGYAGTGKTSVVGAVIKALADCRVKTVLLAPTGRAAKVASAFSGRPASTIHKRLFRGNSADPANHTFFLAENNDRDTVFIIDEASMVTDSPDPRRSLLCMLSHHVYSAPGCAMILVGDEAQLPPVGLDESPAMNPDRLRAIGLNPVCFNLDIPVRQAAQSGILHNATIARHALYSPPDPELFYLEASGFPDIRVVDNVELADSISDSWSMVGQEETLIVTRSNRRANDFNTAIRNIVMMADEPLQRGDRIIIAKNDYYWSKENKMRNFIANGDTAEVTWVGRTEKMYGRYFVDVELHLFSDNVTVGAKLMRHSLVAEGPSIPREEMERLYNRVLSQYEGELSHKIKGVMEDPYYNALQAKYAYCVTCHKAQGGQWKHVYIDMGNIQPDAIGPEFYRWLYTSMTRATERVFLVNPCLRVD